MKVKLNCGQIRVFQTIRIIALSSLAIILISACTGIFAGENTSPDIYYSYTHSSKGYQFVFPTTWHGEELGDNIQFVLPDGIKVEIRVYDIEKIDWNDFLLDVSSGVVEVSLSNQTAYQKDWITPREEVIARFYHIITTDSWYLLAIYADSSVAPPPSFKEQLEQFDILAQNFSPSSPAPPNFFADVPQTPQGVAAPLIEPDTHFVDEVNIDPTSQSSSAETPQPPPELAQLILQEDDLLPQSLSDQQQVGPDVITQPQPVDQQANPIIVADAQYAAASAGCQTTGNPEFGLLTKFSNPVVIGYEKRTFTTE